jgi:hypothetical protein
VGDERGAEKLQQDLEAVYKWARDSNMEFNGGKFQLLRYGRNSELKSKTFYKDCDGVQIGESLHVKDLGVIMSSDGKFTQQIESVVQKATRMTGWVLRTFKTRDVVPMMTLYKSLILSQLDYCSALWNPSDSAALCNRIESVQRTFARRIIGLDGLNYWERLKRLRLYSVQRRRERFMIFYVFKIIHGLVPNCGLSFHMNSRTGMHVEVSKVCPNPAYISKLRSNCFTHVAPLLYNLLPIKLRQKFDKINPFDSFKRGIDIFLNNVPDEPTVPGLTRCAKSNSLVHQVTSYLA